MDEKDFKRLLDEALGQMEARFDHRLDGMDRRFDGIDQRFDGIDQRFDGIDQRFDGIDQRFDGIDQRFNGIDQRFNGIDQRLDGMDGKIDNAVEEMRRHFDATAEQMEANGRLLAETVGYLDEKLNRETRRLDEKIEQGDAELRTMIKLVQSGGGRS